MANAKRPVDVLAVTALASTILWGFYASSQIRNWTWQHTVFAGSVPPDGTFAPPLAAVIIRLTWIIGCAGSLAALSGWWATRSRPVTTTGRTSLVLVAAGLAAGGASLFLTPSRLAFGDPSASGRPGVLIFVGAPTHEFTIGVALSLVAVAGNAGTALLALRRRTDRP
jgi:hypothetical protein